LKSTYYFLTAGAVSSLVLTLKENGDKQQFELGLTSW